MRFYDMLILELKYKLCFNLQITKAIIKNKVPVLPIKQYSVILKWAQISCKCI